MAGNSLMIFGGGVAKGISLLEDDPEGISCEVLGNERTRGWDDAWLMMDIQL